MICTSCGFEIVKYQDVAHGKQRHDPDTCIRLLLEKISKLRGVLDAVEWVIDRDRGVYFCPWCLNTRMIGHRDDCQRQAALDAAGGQE